MEAPLAGTADVELVIQGLTGPNGKHVRLIGKHARGLSIIDLAVENKEGERIAEIIGQAIIDTSRQIASGLTVVGG